MAEYLEMKDLSEAMTRALERLPLCLANDQARFNLLKLARCLPWDFLHGPIGLELRLAGPTVVDFFAAAVPGDSSFEALIQALKQPRSWDEDERARDLATVLERWRRKEGAIPSVARYLLVEVDAPKDPHGAVAVPSIFLAPRASRDFPQPGQPPNLFHRRVEATIMATAELSGVWPDPSTAEAHAKIVDSLPEEGDLFAVGAMLSREAGSSMRIAIRRLKPKDIRTVLQVAGRSRQAEILLDFVQGVRAPKQALAFEIGPGAETRVGLELSPPWDWKGARSEGWPELLEDLVARGVVDPERAAVVTSLIDAEHDPLWGLAHIKIAADETGMMPFAKLYVGLLHREPCQGRESPKVVNE